jgi:predicted permease
MILVWRGLGILVPIVWFATACITEILTDKLFGTGTYAALSLPKILGSIAVGLLLLVIGVAVNKDKYADNKHSFFWIPIEFWVILVPVFTIIAVIFF